jgi:HSP20 family protein
MYESLLNFPDFTRLHRELDELFNHGGAPSSIRSVAPGSFPALNVGHTPGSVEVYAFAPGLDAGKVDVTLDRGVLTLSGERTAATAGGNGEEKVSVYSRERPTGRFKRAVNLPDDIDPTQVTATYRDGVLRVSIARRAEAQPQRINVQ